MTPDADRIGLRHALAGLAILATTGPALAQDTGRLLSFGTSFGFIADDNPDLDPDGSEGTVDAFISTDLLFRRATRVQSLALSGNAQFRNDDGSDAGASSGGLAQSNLNLDYRRESADTALGVTAGLRRDRVEYLDLLAIDIDDDLIIDEIDAIGRTGTRLNYRLDTTLELRRRAPLGVTLSAGLSGVDYSDTNDPDLTDEERRRAGLGLRFTFNPVLRGTVDVDYEDFEDPDGDEDDRDELSVGARLSRNLPTGSIGLRTTVTSTDDGERLTLGLSRVLETPLWIVSGDIGVTRQVAGDVTPVAQIDVSRDLPAGQISTGLRRSVRTDSDGDETVLNALSVNYAREVNPTLTMSMGLSYVGTEPSGDESSDSFAAARVDFRKALTRDWSLNLGLEHRSEDDGDIGQASSNRLSLSLRRAFVTPR